MPIPAAREPVATLSCILDAIGRHTDVTTLLPELSLCLSSSVDFELLVVVVLGRDPEVATLYSVARGRPDLPPSAPRSASIAPPGLGTLAVHDDLGAVREGDPLIDFLRGRGSRAACVVPLATALGPVGSMAFGRSRPTAEGESGGWDIPFLQRVANSLAVTIDNVRHEREASSRERQLEAERDHWRMLLEVTNAVTTTRDLAALRAAIAPNVRRMVPHDHTNLFLVDDRTHIGAFVLDPTALPWPADLAGQIRLDTEPYKSWLAPLDTVVDVDVVNATATGWEALRAHCLKSGVKRICNAPLLAPHRVLGVLSLGRLKALPFTQTERYTVAQVAAQIAIALENALAFDEIAVLKERLARENVYLQEELRGSHAFEEVIGESRALRRVLEEIDTVADTDTTVLLLGETGTGKELLARALHAASHRSRRPLVTVNCTTSPAGLLESEWFGYERGAFTGAAAQKIGRFELAHQGTLFLDEIGDVPLDLQSKLLRVLQEREIERLGSTRTIRVDFRLIAATNRSLEEMVRKREFRADLYYRLNVFPVRVPPLRERPEDIPPLVRYFVQRFGKRLRRPIESISPDTMELLCRWPWPGNVRELQNVIERAVILSRGPILAVPRTEIENPAPTPAVTLKDAEREHILRALAETQWVIGGPHGAAARLGLKRTSLVSTMRRLHIVRPVPDRESAASHV